MHRGLRLPVATSSGRSLGACQGERCLHAPSCVPAPRLLLGAGQDGRRLGRSCQAVSDGSSSFSHNDPSPLADGDSLAKTDQLPAFRNLPQCMVGGLPSNPTGGVDSEASRASCGWEFSEDDASVPGPSNTPVNEGFPSSMSLQLWAVAAERAYQERPAIDMLTGRAYWRELNEVYVILFGVGERETEGIYSLRAVTVDGLPQETIIAFEDEEDAQRYAGLLEATMDHLPNVCSIPPQELLHFCVDAGYSCRLEQKGSLLIPPDFNVGVTDWERSLRLREGHWSVLEEEPALQRQLQQRTLYASDPRQAGLLPSGNSARMPPPQQPQPQPLDLTAQELDSIRAQLERLLNRDT